MSSELFNNSPKLSPALPYPLWQLCFIHLFQSRLHIDLAWIPNPFVIPSPDSMTRIHREKDRNPDVGSQEARRRPILWEETSEAIDEAEDRE